MAQIELTVQEARSQSSNFMYIFATNKFLSYIPKQYATVIAQKRANQMKILKLSADKYLGGVDKWSEYVQEVREGFNETYGMSPAQALEKLALGQEVAGKNWAEGVYGVGSLYPTTFSGADASVSVDKTTGHIFKDGVDITDTQDGLVYAQDKKGNAFLYQVFSKEVDGVMYMSQYNKTGKRYVAKTYSITNYETGENAIFNARTGNSTNSSDSATIWENIKIGATEFNNILVTLLKSLGINIPNLDITGGNDPEQINASNTLPNQKADGFVTEAGIGEAGAILLALAGGGLLLASAKKKKAKSNK